MRTAGDSMLSCKCSSMVMFSERGSFADRSWLATCSHSASFGLARTLLEDGSTLRVAGELQGAAALGAEHGSMEVFTMLCSQRLVPAAVC